MGADFTYAILPLCELTEERKTELNKMVDNVTLESLGGDSVFRLSNGEEGDPKLDDIKNRFRELIDSYPDFDHPREIGQLQIPDNKAPLYIITGGMSWGDGPTEAYTEFNDLDCLPGLWQILKAWAIEDTKKPNEQPTND